MTRQRFVLAVTVALPIILLFTAARHGWLPDGLSVPLASIVVHSDQDPIHYSAPPDCTKTKTDPADQCNAEDWNSYCKAKGSSAGCENCPAGTKEPRLNDEDGDGCCCSW